MRVLYVTGSCLTKNTSANMSHNGYVQGLLENGVQIDIIMAEDGWGETDPAFPKWKQINYYVYNSESLKDILRKKGRRTFSETKIAPNEKTIKENKIEKSIGVGIRTLVKKLFYAVFPNDPLYPLEKKWLKTASRFKSDKKYDLVISNSSPAASHKLVSILKNKKAIYYKKWIQIWEDPWYFDLYGGHTVVQKEEEHRLLREADKIYYVSPLTLMYQKRYFSDCSNKMCFVPLSAFEFEDKDIIEGAEDTFGYFGDYYSQTRNIEPFFKAAKRTGIQAFIIGDSNLNLSSDERIKIVPRITLSELSEYQRKTHVLVHLCNLKGGQIPGKIYHYSITRHPILFILDGTEEEKEQIYLFFLKYNRYEFCENKENEITESILRILNDKETEKKPIEDFYPKNIIRKIIEENK